ncbi:MAG: hypothetical protein ACW98D_17720 [Promethearchaeota archaeon]|jgi:hypothetical protein
MISFLKDPLRFRDALLYKLAEKIFRKNEGFYIFNENWDNMIILDACRYDYFRDLYIKRKLKGNLFKKISRGSHTETFLLENFKNKYYPDIVYITANPYVNQTLKNRFYRLISVWDEGWSEEHQTVLPETLYEFTLDAMINYPDKKLIIHFMQPHPPFINRNLGHDTLKIIRKLTLNNQKFDFQQKFNHSILKWFGDGIYSKLDKKSIFKTYGDNLEIITPYIKKLLDLLPGVTVLTADHGEALGERLHRLIPIKFYGHMRRVRIPSIIDVPWLIVRPEEKDPSQYQDFEKRMKLINSIRHLKEERIL